MFAQSLRSGTKPGECGFFFDFDGTLAPIQTDPETVQPVPGIATRLKELAGLAGLVALVSARPASFLTSRFESIDNIHYFGLYGVETASGSSDIHSHPVAEAYSDLIARVADRAEHELPPGINVERKRVTVALHFRANPHLEGEAEAWAERAATEHGLNVQAGRMVFELKPPGTPTKGTVVERIASGLRFVWCFGDDVGDIAAFESLARLRQAVPGLSAVLVAVHNPESGTELASLADVLLPAPSDVPGLLDRILDTLRG
jgi:trehalose 6-phosphate phosphatase